MAKEQREITQQKLDTIIQLLRHILAAQLYKHGVPQAEIAKHLHVATALVVKMLKGIKKEK